jgi:CO/xanthine dehydrogenase FAD-binding subunit
MPAAAFDYERPDSLERAIALLAVPGAVPLAGGQSLIPLLNSRSTTPRCIVDISRIAELRQIEMDGAVLRVGAAVRLAEIEKNALVADFPLLAEAIASTASPAIRNRATLVGNLVRASPQSELPVAVVALDATLVIEGKGMARRIAAADFFLGPHCPAIGDGEIVVRVEFPRRASMPSAGAFCEICPRAGAPPLICVAIRLELDDGVIAAASVVAGGITGRPSRCTNTEAALLGHTAATATGGTATEDLVPLPDLPSANYALEVLPIVIERAVTRAVSALPPPANPPTRGATP